MQRKVISVDRIQQICFAWTASVVPNGQTGQTAQTSSQLYFDSRRWQMLWNGVLQTDNAIKGKLNEIQPRVIQPFFRKPWLQRKSLFGDFGVTINQRNEHLSIGWAIETYTVLHWLMRGKLVWDLRNDRATCISGMYKFQEEWLLTGSASNIYKVWRSSTPNKLTCII